MKKPRNADDHEITGLIARLEKIDSMSPNLWNDRDVLTLIGQKSELIRAVPIALQKLRTDPLSDVFFYSGDLLSSLLKIDGKFWEVNSELQTQMEAVCRGAEKTLSDREELGYSDRILLAELRSAFPSEK